MELKFKAVDGKKVVLRGMANGTPNIVSAKWMQIIFMHRYVAYAKEFLITSKRSPNSIQPYHVDIQSLLGKHDRVFGEIPPRIASNRGFKHTIDLEEGEKLVINTLYMHPKKFKDEREKSIKELLYLGHIKPSSNPFASSVVLVKKNDKIMRMCIDY
jgi:hypothetical protein